MRKSAYLTTKPLQYINATNIPDQNNKDCFIINNFSDSLNFYHRVKKYSNLWDNIYYFETRDEFYKYLYRNKYQYNKLYLDNDQGFKVLLFTLLIQPIKIFTYEEGYGSYRYLRNKKKIKELVKIKLYKLIRCHNWFGGNYFTKAHYVYKPQIHRDLIPENSKQVLALNSNIIDRASVLPEIYNQLNEIKFDMIINKNVILYISGWRINEKVYEFIEKYSDYVHLIKPHPNISRCETNLSRFDHILNTNLPAELIINKLKTLCSNLIIVHEGSSTLLYISQMKIQEINIAEAPNKLLFDNIYNKFKYE